MKKLILTIIILGIGFSAFCQVVNGDTLSYDNKKILKVWGTHYERGYAHGYLLAECIREIAIDYFIGSYFQNNAALYSSRRAYYLANFWLEDKYQDELNGIIAGVMDAGVDLYSETLQRDCDVIDLQMANALVDISALFMTLNSDTLGCSSMSSWGESTENDPQLNGDLVITRNMDWSTNPVLLANHLLIVQIPDEIEETSWISMTFPGMIGALSAFNDLGISAFMNVGNVHNHPYTDELHPIFFSIRNGIETIDYNSDGVNDIYDVHNAISDNLHLSGSITHTASINEAIIIECNNAAGTQFRKVYNNTVVSGNNLVATNHFRQLYPPLYCYRYDNFVDSLNTSSDIDITRSWKITAAAGGVFSNLHTIQYIPSLDLLKWSTAEIGQPAYTLEPTVFDVVNLFTVYSDIDPYKWESTSLVLSFPNPFNSSTSLSFSIQQSTNVNLCIYNLKGQKIKTLINDSRNPGSYIVSWDGMDETGNRVVDGIYFYQFITGSFSETGRLILLK